MATEGISDVLVNDLLSELKLKPWWEEYRGYGFAVSVAAALSMTYVLQTEGSMSCLPDTNRTELIEDFATPIANFVNTYCVSALPVLFLYAGAVALLCCVCLLAISTFWLHIPNVIDAFETYSGSQNVIEDLQLTTKKLKVLSVAPAGTENKEEVFKVRKACARLWNYKVNIDKFDVPWWYNARNIALCVTLSLSIVTASFILYSITLKTNGIVTCTIPMDEILAISFNVYTCKHKTTSLLVVLAATFIASIILQLIFTCIGIQRTWGQLLSEYEHLTIRWKNVGILLRFINIFWRNSRPTNSASFDDFYDFIASRAPEQLDNRLERGKDIGDVYLIELFTMLSSNWKVIARAIKNYLDSVGKDLDFRSERYIRLLAISEQIATLKWNDDVENLFNFLYDEKYFELFVNFLNIKSSDDDDGKITQYLQQLLKPNFNTIGQPYEEGGSLLYYALHKKQDGAIHRTAAVRILKRVWSSKVFVHNEGVSFAARAFAESEGVQRLSNSNTKNNVLKEVDEWYNSHPSGESSATAAGFEEILEPKEKFEKRKADSEYYNVGDSWKDIAVEISRIKLATWNDDINKFAEDICNAKQWEVLVALMNAFIVEQNTAHEVSYAIRDCQLNLDDAVLPVSTDGLRRFEGSLLYYALSKRKYQPFTLTAAATILSLTKGKEKKVMMEGRGFMELGNFVKQYSGLKLHQKEKLLKLIHESFPVQENYGGSAGLNQESSSSGNRRQLVEADEGVPLGVDSRSPLLDSMA